MSISAKTDVLFIEGLLIDLSIGAFLEEKSQKQPCEISVVIEVDKMPAKEEDHLSKTYDYSQIVTLIRSLADQSFDLVETLAAEIAEGILVNKSVQVVEVTVSKLGAFSDVKRCGCKRIFRQN